VELSARDAAVANVADAAHVQICIVGGDAAVERFQQGLRAMGNPGDFATLEQRPVNTSDSLQSEGTQQHALDAASIRPHIETFALFVDNDDDDTAGLEMKSAVREEIEAYNRTEPERRDGGGPYEIPEGAGKCYWEECPKCRCRALCEYCGKRHHVRVFIGDDSTFVDEYGVQHNPCLAMLEDPRVDRATGPPHCDASMRAFLST
jgi:hypothetical protein